VEVVAVGEGLEQIVHGGASEPDVAGGGKLAHARFQYLARICALAQWRKAGEQAAARFPLPGVDTGTARNSSS
jgi:hypothetical protein